MQQNRIIRLAFCTDGIFPEKVGGMQRHSRLLIEELVKNPSYFITVFHPHKTPIFAKYSNLKEVSISEIDKSKNYLIECYNYSKRVYLKLKQNQYDIIYSQGLSVWYKAKYLSPKLVVNPHGLEPFQAIGVKNKFIAIPFKIAFKRVFSQADYVVSLGGKLTTILENIIPKSKIVVLQNATNIHKANTKKQFPDRNEKLQLLFVSRFAKNKGIHILMRVIEQLNTKGYVNKFFFNLAGKGPLYDSYIQNHQYDNVKYWGFISDEDLLKLYETVDCFVFPTLFEGMPTVVLEAMANKLPIIVTNVGATAELVDSKNGYLIEANNAEVLENTLLNFLMLSSKEKENLAEESYQRVVDNYTWKKIEEKHNELFQEINLKD